jgi:hypothetical protein
VAKLDGLMFLSVASRNAGECRDRAASAARQHHSIIRVIALNRPSIAGFSNHGNREQNLHDCRLPSKHVPADWAANKNTAKECRKQEQGIALGVKEESQTASKNYQNSTRMRRWSIDRPKPTAGKKNVELGTNGPGNERDDDATSE